MQTQGDAAAAFCFHGVKRDKECLKYHQRFDRSAVGQEEKAQRKEPQRNWSLTSFLHLKLLHSKKTLINPREVASGVHNLGRGWAMAGRSGKPGEGRRALKHHHITVHHVQVTESCGSGECK